MVCMDISCLYDKEILIYGIGTIARILLPYLYAMPERIHLLGIALTEVEREQQYQDTGIKIRSIHKWAEECPHATILIATSDTYHDEIFQICREKGFQTIVPVSTGLKDSITRTFFIKFLTEKRVDLTGRYMRLGQALYLNPLQMSQRNSANIFAQLSDIVFPHLYRDWTLLDEGPYDPDGLLQLTEGSVVLDCGANFGTFSAYAASKGCHCYAFEPTPDLQPILREYAGIYPGRITPIEGALYNQDGVSVLHLSSYGSGANSLLERVHSEKDIMVTTMTVDSFVKERHLASVDFIKADIEGAERLMLEGAKNTLETFAPKLSLCTYHLPDDKEILTELILKANPNYKISYRWEKLYAYVPENNM